MRNQSRNSVMVFNFLTFAASLVIACAWQTPIVLAQQPEVAPTHSKPASAAMSRSDAAKAAIADDTTAPASTTITGSGTINTIPLFTAAHVIHNSLVTQTGNGITVNGGVTAASFFGSGAALTNVNATTLGGLNSSAFAQTGASNTFTTDQTITGNLNLTGYINSAFNLQGNLTDPDGQESANIIGGFTGNAAFGGNSVAPGVIGATIGGGGGAYDPSLLPQLPAVPKHASLRSPGKERTEHFQSPPPGTITSGSNVITALSNWSTIAGGLKNTASSEFGSVGGGFGNTASGNWSTVAGGDVNTASAAEATVGGGSGNTASDIDSTVAGGLQNIASGANDGVGAATVGGGRDSIASGDLSTVAGGEANYATALESAVGGGGFNSASGSNATVPGGWFNNALGEASFAAGNCATANYNSSFVWSGLNGFIGECGQGNTIALQDTGQSQFVAAAPGGFFFYTSQSGASGSGAVLPGGSGSWSSLSDRNAKANFLAIDPTSLLEKLAAMPVSTWNYKTQADSIRHLGPTAQDFHTAFGLGEDDKHISTVDSEGVALASIKALYEEMKRSLSERDREIADLRARLSQLEQSAGTR